MAEYFSHPLLKENAIEKRLYQETILGSALSTNTLVVLPTGLGKTALAALVAAARLQKNPESKILFMAPTRPLVDQHKKTFERFFRDTENFFAINGFILPNDRETLWKHTKIAFATPQVVENDSKEGRLNLSEFSLLIVDECHRSVGDYAYTYVAQAYESQAKNKLLLGLSASPGGTELKIKQICDNLFIKNVEIKDENDPDVKPYVKEVEVEYRKVKLPDELKKIKAYFDITIKKKVEFLKEKKLIFTSRKSELLELQRKLMGKLKATNDPSLFFPISVVTELIKLEHALGLVETQSIGALKKYFEKLEKETTKTTKRMLSDPNIIRIKHMVDELHAKNFKHPKLIELEKIVLSELIENPDIKIIIFSNYRDMGKDIMNSLKKINGARPVVLMGQSTKDGYGMSQKEQMATINEFDLDIHNILIATSIGEEGLHLSSADMAIFYEPVPSEIRGVQRRGRVGRSKEGRVVVLVTEDTRDASYVRSSKSKEKKMKSVLNEMKSKSDINIKRQPSLSDFVRR